MSRARAAGFSLAVADLFTHPTVARLAEHLVVAAPAAVPWILPLRATGEAPPLLLMPPAGGAALAYLELARRLPSSLPVWGLDALELVADGPAPLDMATLVARVVDELVPMLRSGACSVGGFSAGCAEATELARQLQARGVPVRHLFLVDGLPRLLGDQPFDVFDILAGWGQHLGLAEAEAQALRALGRAAAIDHVFTALSPELKRCMVAPATLDHMLIAEAQSHRRATAYVPQALELPATLVRSAQSTLEPVDYDWSRYLEREVEVVTVPGSHAQLMSSPHVEAVAAVIAERLGLGDP